MNDEMAPRDNQSDAVPAASTETTRPPDVALVIPAAAPQLTVVEEQMNSFEKATLNLAKIAILISGLTFIFIGGQWFEMHRGGVDTRNLAIAAMNEANTAAESLKTTQRAYISFSPNITATGVAHPGRRADDPQVIAFAFNVPVVNSGTTPTVGMKEFAKVVILDKPIKSGYQFNDSRETDSALVEGNDRIIFQTDPVPIKDLRLVLSAMKTARERGERSRYLYIYGWATYHDVFKGTALHRTNFCFELRSIGTDTNILKALTFMRFVFVPVHNCNDQQCQPQYPN